MHTYVLWKEEKKNLFILWSLMSLCVFISLQACPWRAMLPWGPISYQTKLLLAQVYKPADTLVLFDSWYAPISPSVQRLNKDCDLSEGEREHEECAKQQKGWVACEWKVWGATVICWLTKWVNSAGKQFFIVVTFLWKMKCERESSVNKSSHFLNWA